MQLYVLILSLCFNSHFGVWGECYYGSEASARLKRWAQFESNSDEANTHTFLETELTLIDTPGDPTWYLVGQGWLGLFYYETGGSEAPGSGRLEDPRSGAYLYPDYSNAVVGLWMDHLLLQGKRTRLGEICKTAESWILKFSELTGPLLTYSPPSHYSLGINPLQRDPFEEGRVEIRQSSIPGAMQGLYSRTDIQAGEVITFYSGYIIDCDSSLRPLDRRDLSDEEEHVRNMYNIALDLEDNTNLCIDLPPELGNDISRYNATLSHKANHDFDPNSEFILFPVHPVLGTIMGLAAIKDIPRDSEVTVNYGYNYTSDPDQPDWFVQQWKAYYGDIIPKDEL